MTRRGQPQPQQSRQRRAPSLTAQEARMFNRTNEATAGWCQPMPGSRWHYFPANDVLSLCGRWMFSGAARDDSNDGRADSCEACRVAARQQREQQGGK